LPFKRICEREAFKEFTGKNKLKCKKVKPKRKIKKITEKRGRLSKGKLNQKSKIKKIKEKRFTGRIMKS